MEIAMRIFTRFIAEDRFHDAHIASLDAACEVPGGYTRPFLNSLVAIARGRIEANTGDSHLVSIYKGIVREADILLEGVPCEFDEAANELALWLAEDPTNIEVSAYYAGSAAA
jgi:hypothetical protein